MTSLFEHGLPDMIKTTSIEMVVAPVITHMCYLVLLCESGEGSEQFTKLEGAAEDVAKASKNMATVASRLAAESDDDIMREEMGPVVASMKMSGQHVLLAAQKLSLQPHIASHREELITSTQNVLLGLLKILILEDDATVRKIVTAGHWLLDCLSKLEAAPDIPTLLRAFQGFSEALLLLNNLVEKRAKDLRDPVQQEHLINSMDTLKKCVSMLHTAMCTTIKHTQSEEAQAAKKYILDHVDSTIMELITTVKSNCHGRFLGSSGCYVEKLQGLLQLLSVCSFSSIRESQFDSLLGSLVVHCMVVANTSRKNSQSTLVNCCRQVLQLWSEIAQKANLSGSPSDSQQQPQKYLEDTCASLLQQLQKLNDCLVTAILYQVLDVFVTPMAQFDQLVNAARTESDSLQSLLTKFLSRADRMIQVASFVSAVSTDIKSIENVENSRACLTRLKGVAASLVQELSQGRLHSVALDGLQDLHQRWAEETGQLIDGLSDILDVKELTSLALSEITDNYSDCQRAFKDQSHSWFAKNAAKLIGHMNHIVRSVRRYVDKNDNPIFRNGLLVLVKQVEASMAEVIVCLEKLGIEPSLDLESFTSFSQKALKAIEQFHILRHGLDGHQHPHLLSPLREEARHHSVTPTSPLSVDPEGVAFDHVEGLNFPIPHPQNIITPTPCYVKHLEKDSEEPPLVYNIISDNPKKTTLVDVMKPVQNILNIELLPLLNEVLKATKGKDVTALNMACTKALELSNCYLQAAKEADAIVDAIEGQQLESLRSEVVVLTPTLVQTAQETAMSSVMSTDGIYKQATLFSDRIGDIRQILLPVAGTWYHAVLAMFQDEPQKTNSAQQLSEVMRSFADIVQQVMSSDIAVRGEHQESIATLHSKLKKAQTNAKHLAELALSVPDDTNQLEGPCILWALSIQVLLDSLDKILGVEALGKTEKTIWHQVTPQKKLTIMSENSLRIQEAARLTSSHCKNHNTVIKMRGLQEEVKALTEAYLQAADDLGTVPLSGICQLGQSEVLQRQLLIKMKVLSGVTGRINKEYTDSVQNVICLAALAATTDNRNHEKTEEAQENFKRDAESLLCNVKTASQSVQDCLGYIRDPRVRANLRSINEHLSFQMSDILSRARQMVETHDIDDMPNVEIQIQYWSAKAHFLVAEIDKVEGIHLATKQLVRLGLQGQHTSKTQDMPREVLHSQNGVTQAPDSARPSCQTNHPKSLQTTKQDKQDPPLPKQESKMVSSGLSRGAPSLTYTSIFLKRESDRWDAQNNRIIQETKDMAEKIYHMSQYLRRKGPIQSKGAFVSSAKDVVSSCKSVTRFVRVIADHCLDESSRDDLSLILEQILTITNQLIIISSVNALTPGSKSSDEILVKNAQNLLHIVLQGVRAAETACIKGLRQPEPNSDGAEAATVCFQWKQNLLIHRAQQNSNPETDDLGLRKTALHPAAPSLAPPIKMQETFK